MTAEAGVKRGLSPGVALLSILLFTVLCVAVANVSMVKHSDYKWNYLASGVFAILANSIVIGKWRALEKLRIPAAGLGLLGAAQALYAILQVVRG